jgi:hypothetical protein
LSRNLKEFAYIAGYPHKQIENIYRFIDDLKGLNIPYLFMEIIIELQIIE